MSRNTIKPLLMYKKKYMIINRFRTSCSLKSQFGSKVLNFGFESGIYSLQLHAEQNGDIVRTFSKRFERYSTLSEHGLVTGATDS